ncbi:LAFE_0D01904g1_1 [Lachancea fermentati]|uniref:LAFE_0D01904g1_1 n=1 Tax=Lachancea fermentati TaxID=4955 RepID=A0A1G4MAQ7_LACFM|nr:LAFE_0D01904g1_1 [Lachancea fermentati]
MGQKGSKIEVTKADKAVLQLKISKDDLHRYTRRTELLINNERQQLRHLLKEDPKNGKKNPRVRLILKRIHYQSHLLDQAADQLINLENMVATVEFKLIEQQFIAGLKQGNDVLTKLNKEFAGAEDLLDDVQEQIAYQEEIDQILSTSVVGGFEDELDRELQQLDQEVNGSQNLPELPSTEGLPAIQDSKQGSESVKQGEIGEEAKQEKAEEEERRTEPLLA